MEQLAWTTRRPREDPAQPSADVRLVDEHGDRVVVLKLDSPPAADGRRTEARSRNDVRRSRRRLRRARRSRRARASRAFGYVLLAFGVLVLADAGVTMVWQEPISALYAKWKQSDLRGTLRSEERAYAAPAPAVRRSLASLSDERSRIALLARTLERHTRVGRPVGRIVIPSIHASYVVVYGTSTSALESGPGVYPQTRFPGLGGTTAIAGHRTTFLAPFRHVDALRPGFRINLYMPYAHFFYTVTRKRVVWPTNVNAATAEAGYPRLVLSACTPLFSAEKRLLVYARLKRIVPIGAAARLPGGARPRPIETMPVHRAARAARRPLPAVLKPLDPKVLPPLSS